MVRKIVYMCVGIILVAGCANTHSFDIGNQDPVSYGLAKKEIIVGTTNQQQVLEMFGAPNITTKGSGDVSEVWTYEKVSSEYLASSGSVGGGIGAGTDAIKNVPMGGILTGGYSRQKGKSSVRTVTLIIQFDENEIVQDYKVMETNF